MRMRANVVSQEGFVPEVFMVSGSRYKHIRENMLNLSDQHTQVPHSTQGYTTLHPRVYHASPWGTPNMLHPKIHHTPPWGTPHTLNPGVHHAPPWGTPPSKLGHTTLHPGVHHAPPSGTPNILPPGVHHPPPWCTPCYNLGYNTHAQPWCTPCYTLGYTKHPPPKGTSPHLTATVPARLAWPQDKAPS